MAKEKRSEPSDLAPEGGHHGNRHKTCNCDSAPEEKYPQELPKTVMSRSDVYHLINQEREYQDKKWRQYNDSEWAINDWVVFIRRYLQEINKLTGHPREQMDEMRKVAALAVACMEFNRSRSRNGV